MNSNETTTTANTNISTKQTSNNSSSNNATTKTTRITLLPSENIKEKQVYIINNFLKFFICVFMLFL